jgi:hypothetical protein
VKCEWGSDSCCVETGTRRRSYTSLQTVSFRYKAVCFSSTHQPTHLKRYVNSRSHSEMINWFINSWIRQSVPQWPIHIIHAYTLSLSFIHLCVIDSFDWPLNVCWSSPAQWSLVPSPTGLKTLFYCLTALGALQTHWFFNEFGRLPSKVKVKFILWPTVSRPSFPGDKLPSGDQDQIFFTVRQLRLCRCGTPSLKKVWICRLQLLLDFASAVILGSESRGAHGYILLSQIRDSSQPAGPGPRIYVRQWRRGLVIPPGTGFPFRRL